MQIKNVTAENYQDDPLYRRVVNAVRHLQQTKGEVTPVNVLMTLGMLTPAKLLEWRQGRIPFLEAALASNLSKTNRILRTLRLHVRDLNLESQPLQYLRINSNPPRKLQFAKSGDPNIERAYAVLYVHPAG